MRILLANSPRLCRDTIAALLHAQRPQHEVVMSAPARLDRAVLRHAPDLVLCSDLTTAVQTASPAWLLLYPGGANLGVFCADGQQTVLDGITSGDLLACVDRAAARVDGRPAAGGVATRSNAGGRSSGLAAGPNPSPPGASGSGAVVASPRPPESGPGQAAPACPGAAAGPGRGSAARPRR